MKKQKLVEDYEFFINKVKNPSSSLMLPHQVKDIYSKLIKEIIYFDSVKRIHYYIPNQIKPCCSEYIEWFDVSPREKKIINSKYKKFEIEDLLKKEDIILIEKYLDQIEKIAKDHNIWIYSFKPEDNDINEDL